MWLVLQVVVVYVVVDSRVASGLSRDTRDEEDERNMAWRGNEMRIKGGLPSLWYE